LFNCELFDEVIELIKESVLYNCEARIEMDDGAMYVPVGSGTETGFIQFLQDAEIPVHEMITKKLGRIEAVIPFSPNRKRSITAVRHPDREDLVRIYIKGAPELLVPKCQRTFYLDGRIVPLQDEQMNYIMNDILTQKFTNQGLRAIAFAYKDLTLEDFEQLKGQYNNFQTEADREVLENQLTFLGVFALQDNLRKKVLRSVQFARRGHINVRMVSGDNLQTAISTAINAGIITEEESKRENVCMTGEEFRRAVGGLVKDPHGNMILERKDDFKTVAR
jgi:P-type Ca2+ transporter type 2C